MLDLWSGENLTYTSSQLTGFHAERERAQIMIYDTAAVTAFAKRFPKSRKGRTLLTFVISLIPVLSLVAWEANLQRSSLSPDKTAAVRLQIFLDRADFSPGKIDGRHGDFTLRALELYRVANGLTAPASENEREETTKTNSEDIPNVNDLDLSSADPIFIDYTVSEADLENVGKLPEDVEAQSDLKSMPYRSLGEAIAERFHTDQELLEELNPEKLSNLKVGESVKVPNVEPFDLTAVKDLKLPTEKQDENDADATEKADLEAGDSKDSQNGTKEKVMSVKVDTKINMLSLYENDQLIAAYPVTIGSNQTESPIGEWKVTGVAKMPDFRYDKAMLEQGKRSSDFHILPPGPNNPVGVIWIQLNKKGIGLHGTSSPDTIGRSESHGCVRLANWDVIRLASKVESGVVVNIR